MFMFVRVYCRVGELSGRGQRMLHYNWVRFHETARCTPVMEAGLARGLHDMEWLAGVIGKYD